MTIGHPHNGASIELVVVGASAGGFDALRILLRSLPRDFKPALAIVLHIAPDFRSLLPELFAPHCACPVREAEDKENIVPGTVYFAPPNYHLSIEPDRCFSLSLEAPVNFSRPSIDVLFESAAQSYGAAVLGIVLTGANADGALGLRAVREQGGLAWVEDPATAVSSVMPAAAIRIAGADRVLQLPILATQLGGLDTGPSSASATLRT